MIKTLIVDDEMLELEQLEYLIKKHYPHWEVYKALDASMALKLAKKHKFFLALIDIQMPGKSGLELTRELNKLYELDIIIVSAHQSFSYAQKSIRLGVKDYITKPVIERDFTRVLDKYKEYSSYSDEIRNTLHVIHEGYAKNLTLNSVAAKVYLNPTYLSRKFYQEVGVGFSNYINQFRLEKAKELLKNDSDISIALVAEKCGFNSQHYFSSNFRKKFGLTPSEYQNRPSTINRGHPIEVV